MQRFRLAVVEAERIPSGVFAARPGVEVCFAETVDGGDPLDFVFDRVRVDEVDHHSQSHAVRFVDEALEVVRGAEAPRDREEVGDVIAETAVIRVPRYRHQLDGVVTGFADAGQRLRAEFVETPDFGFLLRHADVALVDERSFGARRRIVAETVAFVRRHEGGKAQGRGILRHVSRIGGDAFAGAAAPIGVFEVVHAASERVGGKFEFPRAVADRMEREAFFFVPSAEISDEEELFRVRSIFPEHPCAIIRAVQSVVFVRGGEVGEAGLPLGKAFFQIVGALFPRRQMRQIGREIRVAAQRLRDIRTPFPHPFDLHASSTGCWTSGRASIFS